MKILFTLALSAMFFAGSSAHKGSGIRDAAELFPGEMSLRDCRINLPLTNTMHDQPYCIKAQHDNDRKQIVLIHVDKKSGEACYYHYYLVANEIANGIYQFYLQSPQDFSGNTGWAAKFNFNDNTDRFYQGECFEETLKSNTELAGKLTEGDYSDKKVKIQ
jgi:hypothetical protein